MLELAGFMTDGVLCGWGFARWHDDSFGVFVP
jgi:hypothetical protein